MKDEAQIATVASRVALEMVETKAVEFRAAVALCLEAFEAHGEAAPSYERLAGMMVAAAATVAALSAHLDVAIGNDDEDEPLWDSTDDDGERLWDSADDDDDEGERVGHQP